MHPDIARADKDGELVQLLVRPPDNKMVQSVNFYDAQVRDAVALGRFSIMLSSTIPRDPQLLCLFPNCKGGAVVRPDGWFQTLESFNKSINAHLKESLDQTDTYGSLKLVVAYGDHLFRCETITGNVYIMWATHINKTNVGRQTNCIFHNVPVLINTDGAGRVVGIFIFKKRIRDAADLARVPITKKSPRILCERRMPLYVCDRRDNVVVAPQSANVAFLKEDEALSIVTRETHGFSKVAKEEKNNFAASIDLEEMDVASLTADENVPGTPEFLDSEGPDPYE
jgi:hypothetical protein